MHFSDIKGDKKMPAICNQIGDKKADKIKMGISFIDELNICFHLNISSI